MVLCCSRQQRHLAEKYAFILARAKANKLRPVATELLLTDIRRQNKLSIPQIGRFDNKVIGHSVIILK